MMRTRALRVEAGLVRTPGSTTIVRCRSDDMFAPQLAANDYVGTSACSAT
jgi:hypothetical protein